MPTYRVRIKPNTHHGSGEGRREGGEEMIVTEDEVRSFGDKFVVIEEIPDTPSSPPDDEAAAQTVEGALRVIDRLREVLGEQTVDDKVETSTVADLQARMRNGDVPSLEDVVGPSLSGKLSAAGLSDPITVYYAEDGDLTAIDGLGVGTLRKLRDVYGKA